MQVTQEQALRFFETMAAATGDPDLGTGKLSQAEREVLHAALNAALAELQLEGELVHPDRLRHLESCERRELETLDRCAAKGGE